MCTGLANVCQELGYQAEIGYQTFLYDSVKEWRKILMFLLEKLPKDNAQTTDEPTGTGILMMRNIAAQMRTSISSPWVPSRCMKDSTRWTDSTSWTIQSSNSLHRFNSTDVQAPSGTDELQAKIPKEVKLYYNQNMPYVFAQPKIRRDVLASVLAKNASEVALQQEWEAEWNQLGLPSRLSEKEYRLRKKQKLRKKLAEQLRTHNKTTQVSSGPLGPNSDLNQILSSFLGRAGTQYDKGSRFQHAEKLQFAKEDEAAVAVEVTSEEDLKAQRERELAELQDELNKLTSHFEMMELNMKKYTAGIKTMIEEGEQQALLNTKEEDSYRIKKGTLDLLPQADENIAKLKGLIQANSDRIVKLVGKWEEIRAPLVAELRELKSKSDLTEIQSQELLEEIRMLRERMKEIADETKYKDDLYKQLVGEYERMSKDTSRSSYTKRIMEIIANIKKQTEEINKILKDTKHVQKEINQLSGKLDRVFQVTDEQVFKDAKKDEARRTAYKLLASIRDNSGKVVETIKETGQIKREQRDLEEQIDKESSKKVVANLEKINSDLQQMKKENSQLVAQLKASS
jgi:hypothetical protein